MITATIGFFDGVHRGHRFLIQEVDEVITFRQHPAEVLSPTNKPKLLNTFEEKIELLKQIGVKDIVVLDFNKSLAQLSAREFLKILKEKYGVERLLMGYDHRFGRREEKNDNNYVEIGKEIGVEVVKGKEFCVDDRKVNSSAIRELIAEGEMEVASLLLGYNYFITGKVITGKQIGRTIGFPTANLKVNEEKIIPQRGVYECVVREMEQGQELRGMINVGDTIEVNIFDFEKELYGQTLRVEFVRRLRDEMQFGSTDELRQQLIKDKDTIENG